MKKRGFILFALLLGISMSISVIGANSNIKDECTKTKQVYSTINTTDDYEFIELTKEEFISEIAEHKNIPYEEAEIEVNSTDLQGKNEMLARGDKIPRSLDLRYGYFTSRFYTPSDTDPRPEISTHARYGVYASYYLPSGNTSWSSRKFNAIHDTFIYAGNEYTAVRVESKNANITSSYNIRFSAIIWMKRDQFFNYYVEYTVTRNFGL